MVEPQGASHYLATHAEKDVPHEDDHGARRCGLASTASGAERPRWEIGAGAFATTAPAYWGSSESRFGGFPAFYVTYRGEDFSILSNGLYNVNAAETSRFDFGLSFDLQGNVDSKDRLFLGDIDTIVEVGPELTVALFADGSSRLEASLAARAAFEFGNGYTGYVIQPKISYLTTLTPSTRLGLSVSPKYGFDGYNQRFYAHPGFVAADGYLGTEVSMKLVHDLTDRFRLSGEIKAISTGGAKNEASLLHQEDWNVAARVGFTYALWQSAD